MSQLKHFENYINEHKKTAYMTPGGMLFAVFIFFIYQNNLSIFRKSKLIFSSFRQFLMFQKLKQIEMTHFEALKE